MSLICANWVVKLQQESYVWIYTKEEFQLNSSSEIEKDVRILQSCTPKGIESQSIENLQHNTQKWLWLVLALL